jgi:hypothetical protein
VCAFTPFTSPYTPYTAFTPSPPLLSGGGGGKEGAKGAIKGRALALLLVFAPLYPILTLAGEMAGMAELTRESAWMAS